MAAHVFVTMGTAASIRFTAGPPPTVLFDVEACFARFDRQYSLYRPESEISRIARGELPLPRASESFRQTYAEAIHWRSVTQGAFTPHRPDGVIDLSGLVKAKAMAAAADVLRLAGQHDWLMNAGGDLVADGLDAGVPWRLGVVDPDDRQSLLAALDLEPGRTAMATSGTAERGEHVWRRGSDSPYRQVTVVADDIVAADVWATAILAGGPDVLESASTDAGVDVIAVDGSGQIVATPRMRQADGLRAP